MKIENQQWKINYNTDGIDIRPLNDGSILHEGHYTTKRGIVIVYANSLAGVISLRTVLNGREYYRRINGVKKITIRLLKCQATKFLKELK